MRPIRTPEIGQTGVRERGDGRFPARTVDGHAFLETLLKSASFAAVTIVGGDGAAAAEVAAVFFLAQDASFEEALENDGERC